MFYGENIESFSLPLIELERRTGTIDTRIWCELPDLVYPGDEEDVLNRLLNLKERGLTDAVCSNIGTIRLAAEAGLRVHGGYGLNITNSIAAAVYAELGVTDLLLSFEMPFPKMRDLFSEIPLGCIIAGRLPLMQFRSCPARKNTGCADCDGKPMITDRTGRTFHIECHERKYSTMHNALLYYTGDKQLPELDYYLLYLTSETAEEARKLLQCVAAREKPNGERTTGMSFRSLL